MGTFLMQRALLISCLLATGAHADIKEGWSVGGGGKVYGSARAACQAFLKETESGGVKYVVERLDQN